MALVPRHHDSLNFLGEIASLSGRNDAALALIGDAIKLKPSEPRYHYDFGTTPLSEGRLEEAVAHLRKAVRKKPDFAAAHSNFWGRTVQARAVGADGGGLPGSAALRAGVPSRVRPALIELALQDRGASKGLAAAPRMAELTADHQ